MEQYQFFIILSMFENVLYELGKDPLHAVLGLLCLGIAILCVIKGE